MTRRICMAALALLLAVTGAGCMANRKNPALPTPAASHTPALTAAPGVDDTGTGSMLHPANPTTAPTANPMPTQAADSTGTGASGIPNFREGTSVAEKDVPFLTAAFSKRYAGGTIGGIRHGLRNNAHVYVVDYTAADKTTGTIYIAPDGTVYTDDGTVASSSVQ